MGTMHINREKLRELDKEREQSKPSEQEAFPNQDSEVKCEQAKEAAAENKKSAEKTHLPGKYILLTVIAVILVAAAAFKIYMDVAYQPKTPAKDLIPSNLNVEISDNMIVVRNPKPLEDSEKAGLILYSGLRIDGQCYLPLMIKLANLGYDCFLPVSSGNQPYLNIEGADSVIRKYEDITRWFLIGHSSACTPAALYAQNDPKAIEGLVFLGGYTDADISKTELPVLSLIGTKDTVVDPEMMEGSKKNVPASAEFLSLKGGNNTGFADTELFGGDSSAEISFEDQISKTTAEIDRFVQQILQ